MKDGVEDIHSGEQITHDIADLTSISTIIIHSSHIVHIKWAL